MPGGAMPGGMPSGMPGGMQNGMPGSGAMASNMPVGAGGAPQGAYGALPGGAPGQMPGSATPGQMNLPGQNMRPGSNGAPSTGGTNSNAIDPYQSPKIIFFLIVHVIGLIMGFIGWLVIIIKSFQKSLGNGLACLFVPCYILYYVINNWDETGGGFMLCVLSAVIRLASFLLVI